jgi:putative membrane protein
MKFEEKFKNLFPDMKKGIGRFPVTVVFSLILFIVAIFTIESDFYILPEEDLWIKYLIIAIPLSASVELVREKYLENKRSNFFRITSFFGIFLFIFLLKIFFKNHFATETINITATILIFYVLFYLIPIIYRNEDKEKYLQSVVGNQMITIGFSIVLFLGLSAIVGTIDVLLINLPNTIYFDNFVFSASIFGVAFFVSRLKRKDESLKDYNLPKIVEVLICYILIPLILIYTAILYLYFVKIIFTLKMPKGIVSHLVLWYTTFSLFIIIMATPITYKNKFAKFYKKYFPLISIPLILLALFSINERIFQYGVTENRYLVVILILWLLFNMIFIIKADVKWVLISFIFAVLVAIFSPFNLVNVSINSQNKRLERILKKNGIIQNKKFINKNNELSQRTKNEIMSIIDYFYNNALEIKRKKIKILEKTYEKPEDFMKVIGVNDSWKSYENIDIQEKNIVSDIALKTDDDIEITKIKGYDYLIYDFSVSYPLDTNETKEIDNNGYKIILKNENLTIKNIQKNIEILNINLNKIANEIYLKIKEKAKRQNQSYVKLPENDLTYLSETKNSKYKIVFYEIHLSEDDKFNNLNINIYFSEK